MSRIHIIDEPCRQPDPGDDQVHVMLVHNFLESLSNMSHFMFQPKCHVCGNVNPAK